MNTWPYIEYKWRVGCICIAVSKRGQNIMERAFLLFLSPPFLYNSIGTRSGKLEGKRASLAKFGGVFSWKEGDGRGSCEADNPHLHEYLPQASRRPWIPLGRSSTGSRKSKGHEAPLVYYSSSTRLLPLPCFSLLLLLKGMCERSMAAGENRDVFVGCHCCSSCGARFISFL